MCACKTFFAINLFVKGAQKKQTFLQKRNKIGSFRQKLSFLFFSEFSGVRKRPPRGGEKSRARQYKLCAKRQTNSEKRKPSARKKPPKAG